MIKINLDDTFIPSYSSDDFKSFIFESTLTDNSTISLHVEIKNLGEVLLPDVYNLAFGPLNENGEIDDLKKLKHQQTNKVFSTIILFALMFLQINPNSTIGIDGSDDIRAFLYHRMIVYNDELLKKYLVIIGVDWYVRLLRNGSIELDLNGAPFFKPKPELFDFQRSSHDLYRYYLLKLID